MTGQGVVCDRSHTSKMAGQRVVCTASDQSFTSKMTGWGAVRTGHDRSHTSKMTGWGAVCDRSGGGLLPVTY